MFEVQRLYDVRDKNNKKNCLRGEKELVRTLMHFE
jgi:hypothetical protein